MAIFYFDKFSKQYGSRNFGDDINPFLLGRLFAQKIIEDPDICILGIGTIINDVNIKKVRHFKKKVIFSSGVGYGSVSEHFDHTWDVACVRGPLSAKALSLPEDRAICDGAVLLSDMYEGVREEERTEIVFIPHLRSTWLAGKSLQKIAKQLGLSYLEPSAPFEVFINKVRRARLVVTEAMHGAILADSFRVPWKHVALHQYHEFKWKDWCLSIGVDFNPNLVPLKLWDPVLSCKHDKLLILRMFYRALKVFLVKNTLAKVVSRGESFLSEKNVMDSKKQSLYKVVQSINREYGSGEF